MESINGYKFKTEEEAIEARQKAADFAGLPVQGGETLYWVDYLYAEADDFWYIIYIDGLEEVLGKPGSLQSVY